MKAIREALDLMKEIQGYSSADIHAAAMAEVEAIENAAKAFSQGDPRVAWNQQAWDDALDLMESIAKERQS